ncbi:MAG TPA: hypothetical protein VHX15_20450 [Frankiaceae bacterium]|nr:hypothetical protein [Frankiaceae bacterium]
MTTDTGHTSRIDLAVDGTTWWLHLDGFLDEPTVSRLDDALRALVVQPELAVVVRVTSSGYAPGAITLLRQALQRHRHSRGHTNPLTVWTDEPAIRAALPAAMLHTPWTDNPDNPTRSEESTKT